MNTLLRLLCTVLLLCLGVAIRAETVVGDNVNCRAAARVTSHVLGTLRKGEAVPVLSASGAWSYVDPASLPACWVRSNLLRAYASGDPYSDGRQSVTSAYAKRSSYRSSSSLHAKRLYASSRTHRSTSRKRGRRSSGSYSGGGSCPCNGSSVCVGPRGGRYCITSGGNKRYGV